MSKRKAQALAGGAAIGAALALGLGAREVTSQSECRHPLTLFQQEQTLSLGVLEAYIESEIAPSFKEPANLVWASDDFNPTLKPGVIAARIMLMEPLSGEERYYYVRLERDCIGGDWKVVKFAKVPPT